MSILPVAGAPAQPDTARALPVLPVLRSLLPGGTLRAGSSVAVEDADLPLLLALGAGAARNGTWAALGLPQLGALAAADAGLDLEYGLWVDRPGGDWPQVLAVLMEAVPVVLVGPLGRPGERTARRIAGLQRRMGAVLLVAGPWSGAQVRLRVTEAAWEGVGAGHGLLRGRRVRVRSAGRGAAAAGRSAVLWLPGPDGTATAVDVRRDDAPGRPALLGAVGA
ncbi:hypothetical protein [Streptomyces sp. NBC_01477]|uniref:hypothetical protein n=1 Tax=Streptomyces sp. NBC_01477 TaxID=2976015 RepID=UPI002E2FA186|nr:hypothetical protein [Streptomyces sp. NBC_01477]